MNNEQQPPFSVLLKQLREAKGLTQEELAERAQMSARGLMYLEHGQRLPYQDTLRRLADALDLSEEQRKRWQRVVRQSKATLSSEEETPQRARVLPMPLTPLFGREQAVSEATALLLQPGVRLLTCTGPAGVGKTRLSLQLAMNMREAFADGVVFVPLAPIREAALVIPALAEALGLRDTGQELSIELVSSYLRAKRMLILFDNFEHVALAAPQLSTLLRACPQVKLLVTSRAALRIQGEQEFEVHPLSLPHISGSNTWMNIGQSSAAALFLYQAQAVKPGFTVTASNALAIAEICRRLDGLPLAIELAAVRLKLFSPEALRTRLTNSLRLLTGGGTDRPERQRTMRSAIGWSYDLLNPHEQCIFRRLAVFAGGWTINAVETICSTPESDEGTVLDALMALVDSSLLRYEEGPDEETRLGMLATIREYAWECLVVSGEAALMRQQHALYYLAYTERLALALTGPEQEQALTALAQEYDNIRAALQWAKEGHAFEEGLRLAVALRRFWWVRGHVTEGRQWLKGFLEQEEAAHDANVSGLRSKALHATGWLAYVQGDNGEALAFLHKSLPLLREQGDTWGVAAVLNNLGDVGRIQGDEEQAIRLYTESLALYRQIQDLRGVAVVLTNLGKIAQQRGKLEQANTYYAESLLLQQKAEDKRGIAYTYTHLGALACQQGDYERALELHEESLELYQTMKDKGGCALVFANLGEVARARGDMNRAARWYRKSWRVRQKIGDKRGMARIQAILAHLPEQEEEKP